MIPGLGRSPGEGISYPLQYSWASLVAQLVKNLLATRETWVRSLAWEDPLEKELATRSSILAILENPTDRGAWQPISSGVPKSLTDCCAHALKLIQVQSQKVISSGLPLTDASSDERDFLQALFMW